jgi:hypothetical protein
VRQVQVPEFQAKEWSQVKEPGIPLKWMLLMAPTTGMEIYGLLRRVAVRLNLPGRIMSGIVRHGRQTGLPHRGSQNGRTMNGMKSMRLVGRRLESRQSRLQCQQLLHTMGPALVTTVAKTVWKKKKIEMVFSYQLLKR